MEIWDANLLKWFLTVEAFAGIPWVIASVLSIPFRGDDAVIVRIVTMTILSLGWVFFVASAFATGRVTDTFFAVAVFPWWVATMIGSPMTRKNKKSQNKGQL
jgi:hypothetical protein